MKLFPNYRLLQPLRSALTTLQIVRNSSHSSQTRCQLTKPIEQLLQVYEEFQTTIESSQQLCRQIFKDRGRRLAFKEGERNLLILGDEDGELILRVQQFMQTAMVRSKLSSLGLFCSEEQIRYAVPEVERLPGLCDEIRQRHQSYIQIIRIQKILSQIEVLYGYKNIKSQNTLKTISQRMQALLQAINQSENHTSTNKNTVPLSQYLKDRQLTLLIVRLVLEANDGILQQQLQIIKNSELQHLIQKVIKLIRQRNQQIQTIYRNMLLNAKLSEFQLLCQFPKTVKECGLDKKLKQCLKLSTFFGKERHQALNLQSCQAQSQQYTPSIDNVLDNPEQKKFNELQYSYNLRLLEQQEQIYTLQQQVSSLAQKLQQKTQSYNMLVTQSKELHVKLVQASSVFEKQSHEYKDWRTTIESKLYQYQQKIQMDQKRYLTITEQLKEQILEKNLQIAKLSQELEQSKHCCKQLQQERKATSKQLDVLKLQNQSQKKLLEQYKSKIIQHQQQIRTLWYNIQQLQQSPQLKQQSTQTDLIIFTKKTLQIQTHLNSYSILPKKQPTQQTIDLFLDFNKLQIEAICPQQPSSQEGHNRKLTQGFLNMKHSKSLSQAFNPEFMKQVLEKQQSADDQGLQLRRMLSVKQKALKRYQFHLQKYRSQNIKHQTTILQLESKVRKYQIQLIQLNELLKSIKLEQQLEKMEENSHLLTEDFQEKDDSNHSSIDNLIQKQITLKIKEESLNYKIEEIIKHVMHLNEFKTENAQNNYNSILSSSINGVNQSYPSHLT